MTASKFIHVKVLHLSATGVLVYRQDNMRLEIMKMFRKCSENVFYFKNLKKQKHIVDYQQILDVKHPIFLIFVPSLFIDSFDPSRLLTPCEIDLMFPPTAGPTVTDRCRIKKRRDTPA